MIGLNQIAVGILNNTCHTIRNITRIRQHNETLSIFHKAIELWINSIVTNSKRLNINVSKGQKLITRKNMFLAIINLTKHIFTIHNLPGFLICVDIHAIFTG